MVSVPFEMKQVEVGMLTPVFPLPEKSQKECRLVNNSFKTWINRITAFL